MKGTITALIRKRPGQKGGFGFIRDEAGGERFFHARNCVDILFEALREGDKTDFHPVSVPTNGKGNGLRAERVRLAN